MTVIAAEVITTVDLTTAPPTPRYRGRHRRVDTDRRAAIGIGACLTVGLAGYGLLAHLAGMW